MNYLANWGSIPFHSIWCGIHTRTHAHTNSLAHSPTHSPAHTPAHPPTSWSIQGPVGAVRVGFVDGQFVANPTILAMSASPLDLIYASSEKGALMLELSSSGISNVSL